MSPPSRFARDTRVTRGSDGVFDAHIDPGWWITRGPNGGYVAAILLRALSDAVDDPARAPRSFTTHFTAAPFEGAVRIEVEVERSGRSATTVSGRMLQNGRLCAIGLAVFSRARTGLHFDHREPPEMPPPESCERLTAESGAVTIRQRYEQRIVPASGEDLVTGGWIRPREKAPGDAVLVAALLDAWPPPVLARARHGRNSPVVGLPTLELTIHFHCQLPLADSRAGDFYLTLFRSQTARDGFVEEDGEIWSGNGTLIAQSRQLAVFLGPATR